MPAGSRDRGITHDWGGGYHPPTEFFLVGAAMGEGSNERQVSFPVRAYIGSCGLHVGGGSGGGAPHPPEIAGQGITQAETNILLLSYTPKDRT